MITIFVLHVVLFSSVALALSMLPRPTRAVGFYVYMSVVLLAGGFLGNAYSLPIADSVTVSGGNLAYGAFMLTAVLFVLAERDVFILRRLILLVVAVDAYNKQLSLLLPMSWWLSINLVTFVVWWIDKRRARRQAFRVPEWTLHLLSLVGGGVGAVTAMRTLRHKTLKPVFRYLHPLLAIAGVAAVAWAWSR